MTLQWLETAVPFSIVLYLTLAESYLLTVFFASDVGGRVPPNGTNLRFCYSNTVLARMILLGSFVCGAESLETAISPGKSKVSTIGYRLPRHLSGSDPLPCL